MISKICGRCKDEKNLDEFYREKAKPDGRAVYCKECSKAVRQKYHKQNRDRENQRSRDYIKKHKERVYAKIKEYQATPKGIEVKQRANRESTRRRKQNPTFALSNAVATRIAMTINSKHKSDYSKSKYIASLPFSIEELKQHLENLFTPEMNWQNYGSYWHIDHIIPISAFNFEKPTDDEFLKCWSLENLQPLPAIENLRKSNKY